MMTIRPMSEETVRQVAALEQECFSDPWSLRSFRDELRNPLAVYYTAVRDGELLGYAGLHHIVDEGHITNIAVAEAYRGQGVGRMLLDALFGYAADKGLALLTLEVRASNRRAIDLYEKNGFVSLGARPGYYVNPSEDAVIMTKFL